jgi:hypothetical protein
MLSRPEISLQVFGQDGLNAFAYSYQDGFWYVDANGSWLLAFGWRGVNQTG